MYKIGLKLWSTNKNFRDEAVSLYKKKYFDYIELYSVPDTFESCSKYWVNLDIPYTIHAAHFGNGMHLSRIELFESNSKLLDESKRFADLLKADYIIIHPGVEGDIYETVRQINLNYDSRLLIENKPYLGLINDMVCVGKTFEEIYTIKSTSNIGFCLDIGHAICSANYQGIAPLDYLKKHIELSPVMYHVTDGNIDSPYDSHLHYGEGTYPLKDIFKLIPKGAKITNESKKNSQERLSDFVRDIEFLRGIESGFKVDKK